VLCGDKICDANQGENCVTCSFDCNNTTCGMILNEKKRERERKFNFLQKGVCGDGQCEVSINETCYSCEEDCGTCSSICFFF
jgi:hypothetical protein